MSDAAAREAAISSLGSVLVQAPAGSGKTTLLTQRYLRLVSVVDAPERILALTFTRRAAQEMRDRVLDALEAANWAQCPQDMNPRTWELAVSAAQRMRNAKIDLQAQPSRLRIETIDAFNAWLQNQLPLSAGSGAGMRVQEDARPSYLEAARRALAHEEADIFGTAVERVLELDDQRWRGLVALIAHMLPSRDRWLPLLAGRLQAAGELDAVRLHALRRQFDEDLQVLIERLLSRAQALLGEEMLQAMAPLFGGAARRLDAASPCLKAWRDDAAVLRAHADDTLRWRDAAGLLLTKKGELRKAVTKLHGFPPDCTDKPAMNDLLEQLDRSPGVRDMLRALRALPVPVYSDQQWERVREVAQVLVLAAAQLDLVFREQGAVDFPAVSMAALRSLGSTGAPTDLNLRLDYRLQHILVDEFQDTSSAQLQLLTLLTAGWAQGDGRSIFCVGDPMQSIYGFRQAEVRAFLELAEEGVGEVRFEVQRLENNFRSIKPLVAWINASFAKIMPGEDDRARGAIAFRPSRALHEGAAADAPAVQFLNFPSRHQESAAIADMLAETARAHPDWRVAVLVRARSHAREIAACLRVSGVAFRATNIEALQDRSIVRDVIMLTRALLHRGDRIAWLALLRGPWVGLSLSDLLPIGRAPLVWVALHDAEVLAQLSDAGRARCTRLAAVLEKAFARRNGTSSARWIESTWLALGGAACAVSTADLGLAAAAFARLQALDEQGMPDAADLQNSFADLFADQGAPGGIEIMTIHKAKGLEFDLVVVPSLERSVPRSRGQLLLLHEFARSGRDGMIMAARPAVGADSDPLFDFLQREVRDAAALEAQRLLYVACTRAKRQLRMTAMTGASRNTADRQTFIPRAGSLLAELWPVLESQVSQPSAVVDSLPVEASTDGAPRGGALSRLPAGWQPRAVEAAPVSDIPGRTVSLEPWPEFDWAGETARRVGTLVHAELRTLDPAITEAGAIQAKLPLYEHWLASCGVPAERLGKAANRVVEALLGVCGDSRGRWILAAGYRDDFREYALSATWNGAVVRAVFDRSFIDAGIRWVIDYKTSQHMGGSLNEFLDREVDRYQPQLLRYARIARKLGPEAVRVGLYFPLMRAWREWAPDGI